MLDRLQANGVEIAYVTLHVSAGTFRPVLTDEIQHHRMEPEYIDVPVETVEAITRTHARNGRVIAVGTTVAKTLETVASWHHGQVAPSSGWSDLFITPGFRFTITDALLTNFHLPRSTLLMLVSAFADRNQVLAAYHQAIQEGYRFYSYGDCMLIL
jgi:S-adenosylmethionine:tRNA ribosyltransferase-isomerase